MTPDGKLTPEEEALRDEWNGHAAEVTNNAMDRFMIEWFENVRDLVALNLPLRSIEELASQFSHVRNVVVLGSGPSAQTIARDCPRNPETMIVCGPTAVGAMLIENRPPDVLMVADSQPIQYELVRDLAPDVEEWKLVLPVTAHPSWYKNSIFRLDQIYFYHPYLNVMGQVDLGFNHILKALCPTVHRYIAQAGSVSNAILNFADMVLGDRPEDHVYLGVDCCGWLTDPPLMRAPAAIPNLDGTYQAAPTAWHSSQIEAASVNETIVERPGTFSLHTTMTSIGYAVNMFWLVHSIETDWNLRGRHAVIAEASKLFNALSGSLIPEVLARDIGKPADLSLDPLWAYEEIIALERFGLALRKKLQAED
jgi:hypothetical protein